MTGDTQIIIVTGASKGIGRATALRLLRDGAAVTAVARSRPALQGLRREARSLPGSLHVSPGDVRRTETAERVVQETISRFGTVNVLVNNVGVEVVKQLAETTDREYDTILDSNLRSVFLFCRAVLPEMRRLQNGLIVNVASTAGLRGIAEDAVYCASKWGVIGLSEALDEEVRADGIRVTTICPGTVDTDLALSWSPADDPYRKHFLTPSDVAEAIAFVVAQPARVAVGQIVLRPAIQKLYSGLLPLPADQPA